MSVFVSNSVVLRYGGSSATFTALSADDESYEIVSLPKKRLDWTLLENILGYRNIYTLRVQQITSTQRNFLYNFIQSADQYVTINGVEHSVFMRDEQLVLDLLDGYIGNVVLTMEFEDKTLTANSTPSRTQGITTSSAGYSSTMNATGTGVLLIYNYGSGDTKRLFRVNSVSAYKADVLDKRWEYIDRNKGIKRLGYRLNFDVDFGNFGYGQTQAQLQDDRDWLKEFVLAPTKRIEVYNQYVGNVVNDFDSVTYSYIGGSIYGKTTRLNFKQRELQTNLPVAPSSQFTLNNDVLDAKVLG